MRQTEYRRLRRAAQDKVAAEVQQLAQAELSRLFRQVQLKIRRVNQYRPRAGVRRPKLRKAYVVSNDMWEMFRRRMHSAVMRAIVFGAISLSDLSRDYFADLKAVEFDSAEFARLIEPEIGERITRVTTSIKREVGQKVVAWYNSPGATMQSLVNQLQERFGASRAATIAQNEVTYLNSRVTENIAAQLGLQEWWWSTRQDQIVCKKPLIGPDGKQYAGCRELHGKIFEIGQKMPPDGSHIGCRCDGVLIVPKPKPVVEPKPIVDISSLVGTSGMIAKADFQESEHPRADDGKWTAGAGGGGGKSAGDKPPKLKPQLEHGTMRVVQERQAERVKAMEAHYPGVKFSPQRYNKLALKEHPDLPGAGLPHAMFDNKATPVTDPAKTKAVVDACNKWGAKPGGYATYTTIKHETGLSYADVFGVVQALKAKDPYNVKMTVDRLGNNHAVAIDQKLAEPAESPKQAEAERHHYTRKPKIASEIHGRVPESYDGTPAPVKTVRAYHVTKRENLNGILDNGFDLSRVKPRWGNDYGVSLTNGTLTSAMEYFTPYERGATFDNEKYAVVEVTVKGRFYDMETDRVNFLGEDARGWSREAVHAGWDGQAGRSMYIYNTDAIAEIREVEPDKVGESNKKLATRHLKLDAAIGLAKANWEETKHPRKKTGQFAPKGQGEASTSQDASGAQKPAKSLPVASGKAEEVAFAPNPEIDNLPRVKEFRAKHYAKALERVVEFAHNEGIDPVRFNVLLNRASSQVDNGGAPQDAYRDFMKGAHEIMDGNVDAGNLLRLENAIRVADWRFIKDLKLPPKPVKVKPAVKPPVEKPDKPVGAKPGVAQIIDNDDIMNERRAVYESNNFRDLNPGITQQQAQSYQNRYGAFVAAEFTDMGRGGNRKSVKENVDTFIKKGYELSEGTYTFVDPKHGVPIRIFEGNGKIAKAAQNYIDMVYNRGKFARTYDVGGEVKPVTPKTKPGIPSGEEVAKKIAKIDREAVDPEAHRLMMEAKAMREQWKGMEPGREANELYTKIFRAEHHATYLNREARHKAHQEVAALFVADKPNEFNIGVDKRIRDDFPDVEHEVQKGVALVQGALSASVKLVVTKVSIEYEDTRAFCRGNEIHLGKHAEAKTVAHEIGHYIEHNNRGARHAVRAFLQKRTEGEKSVKLNDLHGCWGYDNDEVCKPDKFFKPYVGKIYADGSTEVLSMGIQEYVTDPVGFCKKDPEHFALIYNVCHGLYEA